MYEWSRLGEEKICEIDIKIEIEGSFAFFQGSPLFSSRPASSKQGYMIPRYVNLVTAALNLTKKCQRMTKTIIQKKLGHFRASCINPKKIGGCNISIHADIGQCNGQWSRCHLRLMALFLFASFAYVQHRARLGDCTARSGNAHNLYSSGDQCRMEHSWCPPVEADLRALGVWYMLVTGGYSALLHVSYL